MEIVEVSETFAAQNTAVLITGVAGRRIGIRGLQFTIDPGPGAGALHLSDGATATRVVDFGNPSDPSEINMPITPDCRTFWGTTTAGNSLILTWSYAGSGSVRGTLQYEWVVDVTGRIGNA